MQTSPGKKFVKLENIGRVGSTIFNRVLISRRCYLVDEYANLMLVIKRHSELDSESTERLFLG